MGLFLGVVLVLLGLDIGSLVLLGSEKGGWWVLGALLAAFLLAMITFRFIGPVTAVRAASRMRAGELPGRELVDALLMGVGGLLFLSPGLVSDALALILILPGLRALPRGLVLRWARRRAVVVGNFGAQRPAPDAIDVEFREK